jgi:phospholipid/cholesterol/gamma-HCH transport system substrate-binding protein
VRRGHGPSLKVGLIAIVVIVVACYFGFTKANPFADRFELSAAFRTANDIKAGSAVRVAGVNVGKVKSVETIDPSSRLGRKGAGAIVHMELQKTALPIKADARMKIRPRIFLEGNWFVDISPGSPSADELPEGATIPVQQTSAPVQFGQVLTALQSDTRQDLQIVLDEYGRALASGGARGYNRSIEHWTKAFRDSAIVNDAMLGVEPHDLSGYLRGSARFARGLDRDPRALKDLLTNLADTADAFASEERNLGAAINELPRTLVAGRSALGELNDAFPPLRRFVAEMRPAVRSSGPALDATLPLVKQLRGFVRKSELRGLVHDLRPTVPDLTELNEGGVGLQQELRLLSSCTNEVLTPWRNDTVPDKHFPASGPVFQEQVKWLPGIAAESRNFDANGQYVRSLVNGAQYAYGLNDGRFFLTGLPIQGVNPPKVTAPPPLNADVPCETQQPPDLNTVVQAPPKAVKVNNSAPGVAAATARERAKAVRWLRNTLDRQGSKVRVLDRPLLRSSMGRLDRSPKR